MEGMKYDPGTFFDALDAASKAADQGKPEPLQELRQSFNTYAEEHGGSFVDRAIIDAELERRNLPFE